jgi:hypothetical protein
MRAILAVFLVLIGVFLIISGLHWYDPSDLPGYFGVGVGAMLGIMGICSSMAGAMLLTNN